MGISQHTHGTDNARCLIALALITGHVGRPGTGLHPLRGQNNVQGASDAGLIPMVFPDYQSVEDARPRSALRAVGHALDPQAGLTVVEIMDACTPARSRACTSWARTRRCPTPMLAMRAGAGRARAPGGAGHVPHRDRPSPTWSCRPRLAGEGRHGDQHQPPGADGPQGAAACPGEARQDWWIIQETRERRSGSTGTTRIPSDVFAEMAR
jgi:formate dehydrogenase major subunit